MNVRRNQAASRVGVMLSRFLVAVGVSAVAAGCVAEPEDIGETTAEIRGGTVVSTGELEAVVRVNTSATGNGGNCSGTLITPVAVLTAAHCMCRQPKKSDADYPLDYQDCRARSNITFDNVRLANNSSVRDNVTIGGDVKVHPGFPTQKQVADGDKPWLTNDYALVILDHPVRDDALVYPIQVAPRSKRAKSGDDITIVGYGQASAAGVNCGDASQPGVSGYGMKRKVTVDFQKYKTYADPASGATMTWANSSAGSCPGDSGGPALGWGRLLGVASTGNMVSNFAYDAHYPAFNWLSANACPSFDQTRPDATFCTELCPCAPNEGDCDKAVDCVAGTVCERDLGFQVGLPKAYDVCEKPSQMVTIYKDYDFGGASQGLPVGTYRAEDLWAVGNDALSSIAVPPGLSAYVCTDRPGIGTCRRYSGETARLDSTMNNRASYIRVSPALTVYEGTYFSGRSKTLVVGEYGHTDLWPVRNDTISSLTAGPGLSALLCSDRPGIGTCRRYTGDVPVLESDMNNRTSSIFIVPAITVYRGKNYTGISQSFPIGIHRHTDFTKVGNDRISSIIVPPGLSAYVCSDRPGIGTCREYGNSASELGDLNDRTSYIEVRPAVTVFTRKDFRGKRQSLIRGVHLHTDLNTVGNDAVTSLIVPEGMSAYVCSDRPGIGTCRWFTGDVGYVGSDLNNRASYIDVR